MFRFFDTLNRCATIHALGQQIELQYIIHTYYLCTCKNITVDHTCTTEALEIKGAANSICLRRIVALCGLGVYGCGLGVYGVRFRSVWCAVQECMVCGLGVYGFPRAFCGTNRLHYTHSALNRLVGVM